MLSKHNTALVGINDSEKLGLVKVNFDMVHEHVQVINEVTEESFKQEIEGEYPELFKGIGLMDSEISIKLKDGAIPSCRTYSQSTSHDAGAIKA